MGCREREGEGTRCVGDRGKGGWRVIGNGGIEV